MNRGSHDQGENRAVREAAAADWVIRCDRGLSAVEQDALSHWLATDARNGAELARQRGSWDRLATLAEWRPQHSVRPNPDLLAPPRRNIVKFAAPLALAVAALITVVVILRKSPAGAQSAVATASAPALSAIKQQVLPDGSLVILNEGALLSVEFTDQERRVRLESGEAHFTVTKNAARPFIVKAQGMDVFAVGTAFNVRLDRSAVEVLVTEGRVRVSEAASVEPALDQAPKAPLVPLLEAGQRAVVSTAQNPEPPQIAVLTAGEIDRVLSWQHRLLDFTDTPLAEVVMEFNRRNRTQIVIVDSELAATRISATFRSDNLDAFVRLIEVGFGVRVEREGEGEIRLHKVR